MVILQKKFHRLEFVCKISNFFHNRAAVFVENVQQGRCEGKKKTGRQKRLLLSAGWLLARLPMQGDYSMVKSLLAVLPFRLMVMVYSPAARGLRVQK